MWVLTKRRTNKLQTRQTANKRKIQVIMLNAHKTKQTVRNETEVQDVVGLIST